MASLMATGLALATLAGNAAPPPAQASRDTCRKTENLVLVTIDGVRWQEVFDGVDRELAGNAAVLFRGERGISVLQEKLAADSREEARRKLMPFLWGTLASQGVLLGDRSLGAEVKLSNPFRFSYPGYNEMLTGIPDRRVNSNGPLMNPNRSVLELANLAPPYRDRVASFSTWERFPWILNRERSGIMVNSGTEAMPETGPRVALLNRMQEHPEGSLDAGKRPDVVTFFQAFEYLRRARPKILHIAFDEPDFYAHRGFYDLYLGAVQRSDGYLRQLWDWLQSDEQYRDRTTLIVTTDHGRGGVENNGWRRHSSRFLEDGSLKRDIEGADDVWLAVMGPDTPARGPVRHERLELRQLAPTMAALLGIEYRVEFEDYPKPAPIGEVLEPWATAP